MVTGCQSTIQSVSLISSSLRTLVQQPSSHDNNRSSLSPFLPLIRILHSHHFLVRLPPSHVPPIIVLHHIPKQHHEHSDPPSPTRGTITRPTTPTAHPNPQPSDSDGISSFSFFQLDLCRLAGYSPSQELIYMEHRAHHFPLLNGTRKSQLLHSMGSYRESNEGCGWWGPTRPISSSSR